MSRRPRDLETRDNDKRGNDSWLPPSLLPKPFDKPGVRYRWVRTATQGQTDTRNVSSRFREGWVPVKREDHPELEVLQDRKSEFKDGIEIGGLLLCETSEETVQKREDFYSNRAQQQLESVDHQYLRENDPRMPLSRPQRRTHVTRGRPPEGSSSDET